MTYKDKLNPEQKRAVQHAEGPLLIVAGAGTGKTTVITERINWLITEKHLKPEEVLALTFTEKAAAEMEERVDKALPYGYVDLWVSTFHSFAQRLLEAHGLEIGLTTDFKLVDQTGQWLLIRNNLEKFDLDYYKPLGNPTKFIQALVRHFSRCKDELVGPRDYLKYAEKFRLDNDLRKDEEAAMEVRRLEEIANAYDVYQQLLLDNNLLDFGDLINYCLDLFNKRPQILKQYQKQFKYILVDEFQDTNYAQYQLIRLLAEPKNNVTVVGDDDQSIYKFRGASVSNILEFKKDYPKAKEVFLNTNYRSRQNILDLSYNFIQLNNPDRLEVKLKVANKKLSKKLKSDRPGQGVIEHLHAPTLEEEMASVINKIQELFQSSDKITWNDFAVLVRANDQANVFVQGLERANIPYQFVASRGLFAKPVILNLIAFLKLLDDYHESDALYRYLTLPMFRLEPLELAKLTYLARRKAWSLWEAVLQAPVLTNVDMAAQKSLNTAISYVQKYASLSKEQKTSRIVFDFLNESGYLKYIDSLEELDKRQEFSYVGQFYKRIKSFEELNEDRSVKNFLKNLGLELESGEQGSLTPLSEEEGPDMVKVMTVHAAKGLEFKYVFIVNLVDRRFPTSERHEAIELPDALVKEIVPEGDVHLQEERRLFYVAMTRAKEGVYFSSAEDYGGARKKKISVFLNNMGFSQPAVKTISTTELEKIKRSYVKTRQIIKDLLPKKFSYTQITDFQNCPRLYYYRYILRIPLPGNHYFSFGSSIHLTLQRFYEEYKRRSGSKQGGLFDAPAKSPGPSTLPLNKLGASLGADQQNSHSAAIRDVVKLEELMNFYEQAWIDDWYQNKKQKEDYFKSGQEILKRFYESPHLLESTPSFLEKGFNLKVGEYTLTGKIDRIDETKAGYKIIDYKTGRAKEKLDADSKAQLLIYQMAARSVLPSIVTALAYYYLENDSQLSFLGTDKEIQNLQAKIIKTIEAIRDFDFEGFLKTHGKCDHCRGII
ncbi:MAG: hypothetical protein UV78_C0044G0003 [Parcubacteria group bacterium GW2011_GWA2_43_17]|nr:MAG: hypothetical protein UV78_C0044G0003 [Parcubacteria group bacterium GW2011_GWA2_43_17]KKT90833.1 MAG: hypothetical protein UW91_C0045G0003 [Parcubacteria group bacterium GW2011_GWF2_45_11]OGY93193.1 MAG: hypothetical protein A2260_00970 [Candidatus Komeilibacteria bacterium RIFOXYA2_FULL_45_9]HAH04158.1 hypothetical protein [Candidatus Komeilibacteria bacterium]HBR13331.1 hypothetical protein [Candidatus Komeilibacteria bacterium]